MSRLLVALCLFISNVVTVANADTGSNPKRVAMVISGYASQGNPALSYDQEELAQSYLTLVGNNIIVDIVSPKGGAVLVKDNKDHLPYIQSFKNHTPALSQLSNTLSAKQAMNKSYDGLFIVGGDGAMFDLPIHADTQRFIQTFVKHDKPIAAVCHGPAALVNIKSTDGRYFVHGKLMSSFTEVEDRAFKKEHIEHYPFILQTELEKRGARFVSNQPMLPYVAQDKNLITAQNPMSVAKATDTLILALGVTPVVRELFNDEATFDLLSRAHTEGASLVDVEIAKNPDAYDYNYMALYGYYAFQLAETPAQKQLQLSMMSMLRDHVVSLHPQYQLALIGAYIELDMMQQAQQAYRWWLTHFPGKKVPANLLEQLKQ